MPLVKYTMTYKAPLLPKGSVFQTTMLPSSKVISPPKRKPQTPLLSAEKLTESISDVMTMRADSGLGLTPASMNTWRMASPSG